jgi:hypothetical protein
MSAAVIWLIGAILSAPAAADLMAAQVAAVKEHYLALGSQAVEAKPSQPIAADVKVARVDASDRIRSASFGHKTTLIIAVPPAGQEPKQYWVEYGKSTNHPAALYGPFAVP